MTKDPHDHDIFRKQSERIPGRQRRRRSVDRFQVTLLFVLVGAAIFSPCWSFQCRLLFPLHRTVVPKQTAPVLLSQTTGDELTTTISSNDHPNSKINNDNQPKKACWKPKGKNTRWQERIHLNDLQVGQELYGHVVQDLLEGKTGPKLFFDCGVGRTDPQGNWNMVNGMLRLPRSNKVSVTQKRASKYRSRDRVPLYVFRIQKGCGRLEVCLNPEDVGKYTQHRIPVTSLQPNQIVEGTILQLYPYGATVDVGANRRGLLHIKKVAALYGRYIDKEKGLIEAGIEKDARVRLMVESVENRRLFLDFTPDAKKAAEEELSKVQTQETSSSIKIDDLDAWAEYANQQATRLQEQETTTVIELTEESNDDGNDDVNEEYDEYDEDSDIEEALGLDMY
jgi:predicted RNA-binding protein with RPS1 domain